MAACAGWKRRRHCRRWPAPTWPAAARLARAGEIERQHVHPVRQQQHGRPEPVAAAAARPVAVDHARRPAAAAAAAAARRGRRRRPVRAADRQATPVRYQGVGPAESPPAEPESRRAERRRRRPQLRYPGPARKHGPAGLHACDSAGCAPGGAACTAATLRSVRAWQRPSVAAGHRSIYNLVLTVII